MAITQAEIDRLASAPVAPQKLLIDGAWVEGQGGETVVLSPINGPARSPRPVRPLTAAVGRAWRLPRARLCSFVWRI
jgi:hypothetical protein